MPQGRIRTMLAAAVLLAVLSSGAAVVVQRRQSAEEDRQARAVAALEAEAKQALAARRAARERSGDEEGSDGSAFDEFVKALGGGTGPSDGATGLLDRCTTAFTTGVAPGSVSFLPNRQERAASVEEQLRTVAAAVEEVRGLKFEHVPVPVFVTADEMTRRVQAQVHESLSPEATAAEGRALVALGALPSGTDLEALVLDSLGAQVAGYYDPATGELVVARSSKSGHLDGTTRTVLAHELDHALADQAVGLPDIDGPPPPGTEDAALAQLALVEGDATLAMQLYGLAHVPLLEQLTGLAGQLASEEDLAAMPYFLQRNLTFPYLEGLSFACALFESGGWTAVDHAYRALPTTSAQVLYPERYLAGEGAVDPRDPGAPGGAWVADPRRALGAAELQWLLEAPGGDPRDAVDHPAQRAAAWGGGEVQVWTDGVRTSAGLALVQHAGQTPLCATMTAWYKAAFPGGRAVDKLAGEALAVDGSGQDGVIRCAGTEVRIGIGPDLPTARAIAQ